MVKSLAEKKKLDFDVLEKILCEQKGNQHDRIFFNKENIESVLPPGLLKILNESERISTINNELIVDLIILFQEYFTKGE